jgi:hypothetical protein
LDYVGIWEDRTTGLTYFSRLSRLFLERVVCVSGPVHIEEMKTLMFPLNIYIHIYIYICSKVLFIVSAILARVAETHEGEEAEPEQFLL